MLNMKLLAILLVSAWAVTTVVEGNCPDADDIQPCYCNEQDGRTFVTCSNIVDVEKLKNFAVKSDDFNYDDVTIQDSSLPSIPRDVMEKVQTKSFTLKRLTLNDLFDDIPKPQPTLVKFIVQKVKVQNEFSFQFLKFANNLKTLYLEQVRIETIKREFNEFVNHGLNFLIFNNTETHSIEKGAFKDFQDLGTLAVIYNQLRTISRNELPQPFNGHFLNFQHNRLNEIRETLISEMPQLELLDVSGNEISVLREPNENGKMFKTVTVDVSENPIKCSCALKWIPNLSKNNILGTCAGPKKLNGRPLKALRYDDFRDC